MNDAYLPQYTELLNQLNNLKSQSFEINTDFKDGKFVDDEVHFGYMIFHIERSRVAKCTKTLEEYVMEQIEEVYLLGRDSVLLGGEK